MRISKWTLLWILVVAALGGIWIGVFTGALNPTDLITSFFTFVFALAVIVVLAIIGAVFVGIFVSHRILSSQTFTPFEVEMLKMRDEVKQVLQKVAELEKRFESPKK